MIIFDDLAKKVLSKEQREIKPLLEEFMKTHFLVGGTAIALYLGHRKSIDYDLFTLKPQGSGKQLAERIVSAGCVLQKGSDLRFLSEEEEHEANVMIEGVKVQLINFNRNPFGVDLYIDHKNILCEGIQVPSLLDLAAMKAFAMMYRKKWKDAVDMYFILGELNISLEKVIQRTEEIFITLYQQEATLETVLEDDWDTTESVEYLVNDAPKDDEISNFLIQEVKKILDEV